MISIPSISNFANSEKTRVIADQILVSGTAFISTILIARNTEPRQFGLFATINLFQLFLLTVQNAVITSPFQVEQARYGADRRARYAKVVVIFQFLFILAFLGTIMLVGWSAPAFLEPFLPIWWCSLVWIAGFLTLDTFRRILLATGQAGKAIVLDAISNILQVLGLFVFALKGWLSLGSSLWIMGLTFLPAILLGIFWLKSERVSRLAFVHALKIHFQQGKWLLLTSMVQWWAGNYFIVAAGVLLGATSFGAIRLAQYILGLLNVVLQAIENYLLPEAARFYEESPILFPTYIRKQLIRAILLIIPVVILFTAFPSKIFLWIGGHEYVSYAYLLPAFAFLYIFIFAGYPVRIVIRVMKLNSHFFLGYLLSAIFGAIAAYPLIEQWGALGVVSGLIVNQLLMIGYWLFIIQRKNIFVWK
jgi:O-antigen/teichoic acid export membrane protein